MESVANYNSNLKLRPNGGRDRIDRCREVVIGLSIGAIFPRAHIHNSLPRGARISCKCIDPNSQIIFECSCICSLLNLLVVILSTCFFRHVSSEISLQLIRTRTTNTKYPESCNLSFRDRDILRSRFDDRQQEAHQLMEEGQAKRRRVTKPETLCGHSMCHKW